MKRHLRWVVIAAGFFVAMMISAAWADSTKVTIIYSNNINGQIDPAG